jgi:hypothetical protein
MARRAQRRQCEWTWLVVYQFADGEWHGMGIEEPEARERLFVLFRGLDGDQLRAVKQDGGAYGRVSWHCAGCILGKT